MSSSHAQAQAIVIDQDVVIVDRVP